MEGSNPPVETLQEGLQLWLDEGVQVSGEGVQPAAHAAPVGLLGGPGHPGGGAAHGCQGCGVSLSAPADLG